jgi:uncharacterized membrane protein (UPF0127 family)
MLFRADGFFARLLGLLGKSALAPNHALWLPRCSGVHTFGMQFPIGVFFVDRAGAICKIIACLKPNRIAVCRSAVSVVEMAAFENGQEKRLKQAVMQALIRSQS